MADNPTKTAIEVVGAEPSANGPRRMTLLKRTDYTAAVWGSYSTKPRCKAEKSEFCQCDLEEHEGDRHEFTFTTEFVCCAECHGGPQWRPELGGEVIVHDAWCPLFEDAEDAAQS